MSLQICTGCTTAYSAGAQACPHCGSTEQVEQGSTEHAAWLHARSKPVGSKGGKALKEGGSE